MEFYIKTLDFLERVMNGVMAIDPGQQPFISQDLEELNEMRDSLLKASGQAERSHEDKAALPLQSVIGRLLRNLHIKCDKCADGRVKHDHSEQIGSTWIEVYKCDRCGEQFV